MLLKGRANRKLVQAAQQTGDFPDRDEIHLLVAASMIGPIQHDTKPLKVDIPTISNLKSTVWPEYLHMHNVRDTYNLGYPRYTNIIFREHPTARQDVGLYDKSFPWELILSACRVTKEAGEESQKQYMHRAVQVIVDSYELTPLSDEVEDEEIEAWNSVYNRLSTAVYTTASALYDKYGGRHQQQWQQWHDNMVAALRRVYEERCEVIEKLIEQYCISVRDTEKARAKEQARKEAIAEQIQSEINQMSYVERLQIDALNLGVGTEGKELIDDGWYTELPKIENLYESIQAVVAGNFSIVEQYLEDHPAPDWSVDEVSAIIEDDQLTVRLKSSLDELQKQRFKLTARESVQ